MKICTKCSIGKELEDFYRDKRAKDGFYSKCKVCHNKVTISWGKRHPEYGRMNASRWSKNNPGKHQIRTKEYRKDPAYKAKTNQWNKNYKGRNPAKIASINAFRRAAQLQATPPWLTKEMLFEIELFYKIARLQTELTGTPHQVDHIMPLMGDSSRGLHVPWNLQLLSAPENMSKHNKLTS